MTVKIDPTLLGQFTKVSEVSPKSSSASRIGPDRGFFTKLTETFLAKKPKAPPAATTQAIGEEGGTITTMAIGEEGGTIGLRPMPGPANKKLPISSSAAIGKVGPKPKDPPVATTMAIGEEGGTVGPKPPQNTTMAIGEEGGTVGLIKRGPDLEPLAPGKVGPKPKDPPVATTMAIGEEGGTVGPKPKISPVVTTMAIGEEGGTVGPKPIKT